MISARTAFLLYAAVAGVALLILKGKPLALALIIVFALAAKTYVDELRRRL
jgi:hypothetical protein